MPVSLPTLTLHEETLTQDSLEIIKAVRPTWDLSVVQSKLYTDGITNKLIGFFLPGKIKQEVVMIKMYGQNSEMMINRDEEIKTMTLLWTSGIGPELYAIFANGICYEFIQGDTLTMETVRDPNVFPLVAKAMAQLHESIPLKEKVESSQMWSKMDTFNSIVTQVVGNEGGRVNSSLKTLGYNLEQNFGTLAIKEMKSILEPLKMPLKFCHNDILLGNVIYNSDNKKVSFIDFEYAMANYAAFDVANHFNEFAGIDNPDFSKCPSKEFKSKWIQEYFNSGLVDGVTMDTFQYWVELCLPASHLFWALWAICQAEYSNIEFDYVGYFGLRYTEYLKMMRDIKSNKMM